MQGQVRNKMTEKLISILADEAELMTIPGIGPSKATAIIQYGRIRAFQNPGIADGSIRDWPENVRKTRNSY